MRTLITPDGELPMTETIPFNSPVLFEEAFVDGLERQLSDGALGAFILVLANATFEERLWARLRERAKRAQFEPILIVGRQGERSADELRRPIASAWPVVQLSSTSPQLTSSP